MGAFSRTRHAFVAWPIMLVVVTAVLFGGAIGYLAYDARVAARESVKTAAVERAAILEKMDRLIGGMSTLREKMAVITTFSQRIRAGQEGFYPVVVRLADEVAAREERARKVGKRR